MCQSFPNRFMVAVVGCLGAGAMAFLSACSAVVPPDDEVAGTPPTGDELFLKISGADAFEDWAQFPDRQGTVVSALPHGPMSRVFINDEVEAALANFTGTLPADSIIVKENIGEDPAVTEAKLTVMWKVPGFDPDGNDWFWANMSPTGEITAEGRVAGCMGCHGAARNNDFVFVHQF